MARSPWNCRGEHLSGGQLRFHRRGGTVQLTSPVCLDVSARALGLSCCEVPALEPFVGLPDPACEVSQQVANRLRDWPPIWAIIVDFGIAEVAFAIGRPQFTRALAERAARREVAELEESNGLDPNDIPESTRECTTVEQFLAVGEPWVVLYGPLSPSSFAVLCQLDRSSEDDLEAAVLTLQSERAWELTRTAALALRRHQRLPHLVQRRIFAFAFTARALSHA